jgi:hypothetical protein
MSAGGDYFNELLGFGIGGNNNNNSISLAREKVKSNLSSSDEEGGQVNKKVLGKRGRPKGKVNVSDMMLANDVKDEDPNSGEEEADRRNG